MFLEKYATDGTGYRIAASKYYINFQTKTAGGDWETAYRA